MLRTRVCEWRASDRLFRLALLACLALISTGCCDNSERCNRSPVIAYLDSVWPDNLYYLEQDPVNAVVTGVTREQFTLNMAGATKTVKWFLKSMPPPFAAGQAVTVEMCSGPSPNGRPAFVITDDQTGKWLYAAVSGFEFYPYSCLPAEVVYDHRQTSCCGDSWGCTEISNSVLVFEGDSPLELWNGDEDSLTIGGEKFTVRSLYSITMDGTYCTDVSDRATAFVMARPHN